MYHRNQVFLTYNGKIIMNRFKMYYPERVEDPENPIKNKKVTEVVQMFNHKFYPFITISSKKITLQAIFENSYLDFVFPYLQELEKL